MTHCYLVSGIMLLSLLQNLRYFWDDCLRNPTQPQCPQSIAEAQFSLSPTHTRTLNEMRKQILNLSSFFFSTEVWTRGARAPLMRLRFSVSFTVATKSTCVHAHRATRIHTSHRLLSNLFSAQLVLNEVIMTH